MQQLCQICGNPKRRLRFHTEQLAICQWCVTELSKSDTSPAKVFDERRSLAMSKHREAAERERTHLHSLRQSPPQAPNNDLENSSQYALGAVRREEGLLQSLYRSMIDDTRRRDEVAALTSRRREEILAAYREATANHTREQQEIESKIRAIESKILQIPTIVEDEIRRFTAETKNSEPTKRKEVKLIRALTAGLISYDRTQCTRPADSDYDIQKKRIRQRDSNRCVCCLRGFAQGELHVHHVLPLYLCGTNNDSNLVTLCHPCHNKQHPKFKVTRSYPIKRRSSTSRFIAVDIETTGLSNDDSIIEIAAVKFVGSEVEEIFCSLVRSEKPLPANITQLTGITQSMLVEASDPEIVFRDFVSFISNYRLVFHNASFDMRYINRYLKKYNYQTPSRIIDTLPIARKKLPNLSNHRLEFLIKHLGLPASSSHRAKEDSIATGRLYLALRDIATPRSKKNNNRKTQTPKPVKIKELKNQVQQTFDFL